MAKLTIQQAHAILHAHGYELLKGQTKRVTDRWVTEYEVANEKGVVKWYTDKEVAELCASFAKGEK